VYDTYVAEDDTYSVPEASKVLRLSERRVQQMLQTGEMPGTKLDSGYWRIPMHAVHARKDETKSKRTTRRYTGLEDSRRAAGLENELRALEREIGRLQGQRELEAVAQSTLREALDRERDRTTAAEERAARLEDELREARRSWWRRIFG
jgi:excisionase family DNA binding protein